MVVVRTVALVTVLAAVGHAAPARAEVAELSGLVPTFALRGCSVDQVEASGATLAFDAHLANPTAALVLLGGVTYALDVEGKRVFEGSVPGGVEVPAGGSAAVPLPGRVRYADLPGVAAKVALKKRVPYRLVAAAAVRTSGGDLTVPVTYEGELSVPKPPGVGLAGLRITSMNPFDAAIEVRVALENENTFPLPAGVLRFRITVAGGDLSSAEAALPGVPAGGKVVVAIPLKVSLRRAASGVVKALQGDAALVGLHAVASIGDLAYPVDLEARLPTVR